MSDLRLTFSDDTDRDLEEIWVYLARYDIDAADAQITNIVEKCTHLTKMPHMGTRQDELKLGLRRIIEGNYSIFYLVRDNEVQVVRVLRSNRDFKRHF